MKRQLFLFLALGLVVPALAEPIPPGELPRPERSEPDVDRSSLHPAVFEVDFYRLGLEGGLNSTLIRYDKGMAPLIEQGLLRRAFQQTQELQNAGGRAEPNDPEDSDVRDELTPSRSQAGGFSSQPWTTGGNSGLGSSAFLGTNEKSPLILGANRTPMLRLTPTPFAPNVIAGAPENELKPSVVGAVIGGGGDAEMPNRVTADFSTIGGGVNNLAGGDNKFLDAPFSTIGGGRGNRIERRHGAVGGGLNNLVAGNSGAIAGGKGNVAKGDYSTASGGEGNRAESNHASIGGGQDNQATSETTTVAGGAGNVASGVGASIGGGSNNQAGGAHATIPGGTGNSAAGMAAFAAGANASAEHDGSFVWSDASGAPFGSTGPNQVLLRAAGNVGIDTTRPREKLTVGGNIAPATDDTFTLGSDALRWRDLKLSGSVDYVGHLTFADSGSPRMRLDEQGNLHVSGQVYTRAFDGRPEQSVGIAAPPPPAIVRGPDLSGELAALASRVQRIEKRPTAPIQQGRDNLSTRIGDLEAAIANLPTALPAPSTTTPIPTPQDLAPIEQQVTANQQDLDSLMLAVETLAKIPPGVPRQEFAALSKKIDTLELRAPANPEFDGVAQRLQAIEAKVAAPAKELARRLDTLEQTSARQEALLSLTAKLDELERVNPAPRAELGRVADRVQAIETKLAAPAASDPAIVGRLNALEQQSASKASLLSLSTKLDNLAAKPTPPIVPDTSKEVAALQSRVKAVEGSVGALASSLTKASTPAAALAAVDQRLQSLEREAKAFATQAELAVLRQEFASISQDIGSVKQLQQDPKNTAAQLATATDLNALRARIQQVEQRAATPAKPAAISAPLLQRLSAVENRATVLERKTAAQSRKPAATSVGANVASELEERIDLAVSTLSQRQAVNDSNLASLRKQVAQTKSTQEAMGLSLSDFGGKIAPIVNRLVTLEQSVAAAPTQDDGPANAQLVSMVQSLGTRQDQSDRSMVVLRNEQDGLRKQLDLLNAQAPPDVDSVIDEQRKLAEETQSLALRVERLAAQQEKLPQVENQLEALRRKVSIAASQPVQPAAAASPASSTQLAKLQTELLTLSTQMANAKRERAAIQRDQLRLLSMENKVKRLALQPAPASVPAPARTPSTIAPASVGITELKLDQLDKRYQRQGGAVAGPNTSAKEAESMAVLANLIGLKMREYSTAQGKGVGPVAAEFEAAFGGGGGAGIDPAEGVALTAIQGLFQILEAQDRRILELEKKLQGR